MSANWAHGNHLILGNDERGQPVGMTPDQRSTGIAVWGGTNAGKSSALEGWIRQDLLAWPHTRCGIVVFDPHSQLVDRITAWAAANRLNHLPIVVVDLRDADRVTGFNFLRRRSGSDPAADVGNMIQAVLHAWRQGSGDQTPRLERWLFALFMSIVTRLEEGTIADLLTIINNRDARKALAAQVENVVAKQIWGQSLLIPEASFHEQVESAASRLRRILSNRVMRATLCASGPSLNFADALDGKSIILISTSTERSTIDETDAATFAALALNDLWCAARTRGKRAGLRPCYVYCDEWTSYVSPTIATTLAQSRGFGLHFTLSAQTPAQTRAYDHLGQTVFDSVMSNARTQVSFSVDHPQDVDTLALWLFRHQVDLDERQLELYTTKVLGHDVRYLPTTSQATTSAHSSGSTTSTSRGLSRGRSQTWAHTDTTTSGTTYGTSESETESTSTSSTSGRAYGNAWSEADGWSEGHTRSSGSGRSTSASTTANYALDDDGAADEDLHRLAQDRQAAGARANSRSASESRGRGDSESSSTSWSASGNRSSSRGGNAAQSTSSSDTEAHTLGAGSFESYSESTSSADTYGESTSTEHTQTDSEGRSYGTSTANTSGTSWSPVIMPVLGRELSSVTFRSVADQLFRATQYLSGQPNRHFVARIVGHRLPVALTSITLDNPLTTRRWHHQWLMRQASRTPYSMPIADALAQVELRSQAFIARLLSSPRGSGEPTATGRRLPRA